MSETTTTEYLISQCPNHGVKVTSDFESFVAYVGLTLACVQDYVQHADHDQWHAAAGHDCWYCCDDMVTDPHGYLD